MGLAALKKKTTGILIYFSEKMMIDTLSYVLLPQHFKHGEQDMRNWRFVSTNTIFSSAFCVFLC